MGSKRQARGEGGASKGNYPLESGREGTTLRRQRGDKLQTTRVVGEKATTRNETGKPEPRKQATFSNSLLPSHPRAPLSQLERLLIPDHPRLEPLPTEVLLPPELGGVQLGSRCDGGADQGAAEDGSGDLKAGGEEGEGVGDGAARGGDGSGEEGGLVSGNEDRNREMDREEGEGRGDEEAHPNIVSSSLPSFLTQAK